MPVRQTILSGGMGYYDESSGLFAEVRYKQFNTLYVFMTTQPLAEHKYST